MKLKLLFLFGLFSVCSLVTRALAQSDLKLWYNKPASEWTEALPVGNGMLGAMIFGDPAEELLQLNEATFWSGGPVKKNVNPNAPEYLVRTRKALLNVEDYQQASTLARKIQGVYSQSYLPLADLCLKQDIRSDQYQHYNRDLSIDRSLATVSFRANGVNYKREIIASAPGKAIVVRLTADQPGMITFKASVSSLVNHTVEPDGTNGIILKAKAPSQVDPNYVRYNAKPVRYSDSSNCSGMRAAMQVRAVLKGGEASSLQV